MGKGEGYNGAAIDGASPKGAQAKEGMEVIGSNLRTSDRDFLDNQARMEALVGS